MGEKDEKSQLQTRASKLIAICSGSAIFILFSISFIVSDLILLTLSSFCHFAASPPLAVTPSWKSLDETCKRRIKRKKNNERRGEEQQSLQTPVRSTKNYENYTIHAKDIASFLRGFTRTTRALFTRPLLSHRHIVTLLSQKPGNTDDSQ